MFMPRLPLLCGLLLTASVDAVPPPGEGFVVVPGGPVWYHVAGVGPGVPLLALHGGPGGTQFPALHRYRGERMGHPAPGHPHRVGQPAMEWRA